MLKGLWGPFLWLFSAKMVGLSCGFLAAGLLNRSLGPEGRGGLAELQTWVGLLATVFGLSLESATYHLADRRRFPQSDGSKGLTLLILSLVCCSLCTLAIGITFRSGKYWTLAIIWCAGQIMQTHMNAFLQASGSLVGAARILSFQSIFGLLAMALLSINTQLNLQSAVLVLVGRQLLGALSMLSLLGFGGRLHGSPDRNLAWKALSGGFQLHLATISTFIYTNWNQVTMANFCGDEETGYYALALSLVAATSSLPEAFQQALYPRVIHHQDEYSITLQSLRWGFFGWGALVLILGALGGPLIALYGGGRFSRSLSPFLLLLPMLWLLPLSSFLSPYLLKRGAFRLMSLTSVLLGLTNVLASNYLIPRYSYNGAAMANSLCASLGFMLCLAQLSYCSKRNGLEFLWFTKA